LLVVLAGKGDERAFTALYARHKEYVLRLAVRFAGDSETAADVAQEVFIYVIRKLPGLTLTAKFTTYLYPIVKNVSFTIKRKDRPRLRLAGDGALETAPARDGCEPPAPSNGGIETVVRALPEHQREVLLMRFVDDMSMDEIGQALSIPTGTVKSRLHLAIKALRENPMTAKMLEEER
jgi:RNA polymerase sigma-70 factor (ECF subfamily)